MSKVIIIESCEQCPHHRVGEVYTPDSFEEIRKIYCKNLNKYTHRYLEWHDESNIPDECPLDNK